jgi:hypothetical protein
MRARRVVAGTAAVVAVVVLAGCASAAERIAEEATERAIESESGGNAEVDIDDDGSVRVRTGDGSFSASADGSMPEDFPAVPVVDGKVTASWSTKEGEAESWMVTLEVADAEAAFADAKAGLEDAGYEITSTFEATNSGDFGGGLTAEGEWDVNLTASAADPQTVTYLVATPQG